MTGPIHGITSVTTGRKRARRPVGLVSAASLAVAVIGCASHRSTHEAASTPPQGHASQRGAQTAAKTADSQRDMAEPGESKLAAFTSAFADEVLLKVARRPLVVAVLPAAGPDGAVTECSHRIADLLMGAFLSGPGVSVVDRRTLEPILDEIDLGSVFDAPTTARIMTGHVIVIGRYVLSSGVLAVDLKAVDVGTNKLLCLDSSRIRTGPWLRTMAFVSSAAGQPTDSSISEADGRIRVLASHSRPGADMLQLLDRVRQEIRKKLARYLSDAHGLILSPEEADAMFRKGVERSCEFGYDSVTLEMEFGVEP